MRLPRPKIGHKRDRRNIGTLVHNLYSGFYYGIPACCNLRWSFTYSYGKNGPQGWERGGIYTNRFYLSKSPRIAGVSQPRVLRQDEVVLRRGVCVPCGVFHTWHPGMPPDWRSLERARST